MSAIQQSEGRESAATHKEPHASAERRRRESVYPRDVRHGRLGRACRVRHVVDCCAAAIESVSIAGLRRRRTTVPGSWVVHEGRSQTDKVPVVDFSQSRARAMRRAAAIGCLAERAVLMALMAVGRDLEFLGQDAGCRLT